MVGLLKIEDQRTCRADGKRVAVHGKALQTPDSQLVTELLLRRFRYKCPLVEGRDIDIPKPLAHFTDRFPLHHHFLGSKRGHKGTDKFLRSLGELESSGADVEKSHAYGVSVEAKSCKIIVFFLGQHSLAKSNPGRNYLGDTALYKLGFGRGRVFELVAYGNLVTEADKFRKIGIKCMMRKSRHRNVALVTVGPSGLNKPYQLAG